MPVTSLKKRIGVNKIARGATAGDKTFEEIFRIAIKTGNGVKFLRIGCPDQFCKDIIDFLKNFGKNTTKSFKTLQNPKLGKVEFLLANPYEDPFLNRMDAERKDNSAIWETREQIFELARGLLIASSERVKNGLCSIELAFHSVDLVWNLNIVDNSRVAFRSYYKTATGHDSKIPDIHLDIDSESKFAESLISYYNSVRNDIRTCFIDSEKELEAFKTSYSWTSLFKGNAVRISSINSKCIEKTLCSMESQEAEVSWLSLSRYITEKCIYFKPVSAEHVDPTRAICIHQIKGISADQFLWHIQKLSKSYPDNHKLSLLAGFILEQSVEALLEFREIGNKNFKTDMRPYPWENKLNACLEEVSKFILHDNKKLDECKKNISEISEQLTRFCNTPFRDAHLKNRIIRVDIEMLTNYAQLKNFLDKLSEDDLYIWLKNSTWDIDFETCLWKVTEWDDLFHLFASNGLGINHIDQINSNRFGILDNWLKLPQELSSQEAFWKTLFARSMREFCRRLWYDHVMPQTYEARYAKEPRDHFLKISVAAMQHIDGCSALKELLEKCMQRRDDIWITEKTDDKREIEEPIVAVTVDKARLNQNNTTDSIVSKQDLAEMKMDIIQSINAENSNLLNAIFAKLDEKDIRFVKELNTAVERATDQERCDFLNAVDQTIRLVLNNVLEENDNIKQIKSFQNGLAHEIDIQGKLKLILPIIPLLLSYEVDLNFNGKPTLKNICKKIGEKSEKLRSWL